VPEVDGASHLEVERWEDDIARQRGLTDPTRIVVRRTAAHPEAHDTTS